MEKNFIYFYFVCVDVLPPYMSVYQITEQSYNVGYIELVVQWKK